MQSYRRVAGFAVITLLLLAGVTPVYSAGESDGTAVERVERAERLMREGDPGSALAEWHELIRTNPKHLAVTDGHAWRQASACLTALGRPDEAAELLESYRKRHRKAPCIPQVGAEIVERWIEAGETKKAQAAGKRLLKEHPADPASLQVLRIFIERDWPLRKVRTSYEVLYDWAFKKTSGENEPGIRLGLIVLIEASHPRCRIVTNGSILYSRAWCLFQADRPSEAIEVAESYLRKHTRGSVTDKVRHLLVEACLELEPPDLERARHQLKSLAASDSAEFRKRAEQLSAVVDSRAGGTGIERGLPTAEGLSRVTLLDGLGSETAYRKALRPWIEARGAKVIGLNPGNLDRARRALRKSGTEFVVIAVPPSVLDVNFHLSVLELCRSLDDDPMPDFHFGYLTAASAKDFEALVQRILSYLPRPDPRLSRPGLTGEPGELVKLDALHYEGSGGPDRATSDVTAATVASNYLGRSPVVFAGAPYNAVCSRSFHPCRTQLVYLPPVEYAANRVVGLAWLRAGAIGLLGALDADYPAMSLAEWDYWRETACTLGEAIGYQYRTVFVTMPEASGRLERFQPRRKKSMTFADVMLRGSTSRILLSDPTLSPLGKPQAAPGATSEIATHFGENRFEIRATVKRPESATLVGWLPVANDGRYDRRIYVRHELPAKAPGQLPRGGITARTAGGADIELTRTSVRHEVWGGRRYINLQVESDSAELTAAGTTVCLALRFSK